MTEEASPDDWGLVEAAFKQFGFLCPDISPIRHHYRRVMGDWFGLAEQLNELGQRAYVESSTLLPGRPVRDRISLVLQMMPRCLGAFQAAIVLSERGAGLEAQSLVRAIFETAFWMGYVCNDPDNAIPHLERDTLYGEIGLYEAAERHLRGLDSDTLAECKSRLAEFRSRFEELPRVPPVEELARRAGYGPCYFFYKDLSGAAIHLSMKTIDPFLNYDENGVVIGHQIGPDDKGVGKAVWLGCRAIALAVDALNRTVPGNRYGPDLRRLNEELERLKPYCLVGAC